MATNSADFESAKILSTTAFADVEYPAKDAAVFDFKRQLPTLSFPWLMTWKRDMGAWEFAIMAGIRGQMEMSMAVHA